MKLWNAALDIIILTPEQLAMDRFLQKLPLIAGLILAAVVMVALIVRGRRK